MLQVIIDGSNAKDIISLASDALAHGCRWIRLDTSLMSQDQIQEAVEGVLTNCRKCEAFLSLENSVEIAKQLKADGVHINADASISPIEARKSLGEEPFLGITIKDSADVPFIPRTAVDYIVIENDSLEECRNIVEQFKTIGLDEPVVATFNSLIPLEELFNTGINGIAVHHSLIPLPQIAILIDKVTTLVEKRLANI